MQRHTLVRPVEAAVHEHHHSDAHVLACPAAHVAKGDRAMIQVFDTITHTYERKFCGVLLSHATPAYSIKTGHRPGHFIELLPLPDALTFLQTERAHPKLAWRDGS